MKTLLLLMMLTTANPSLSKDFRTLQSDIKAVQRLQDHNFLPEKNANAIRNDILGQASVIHGSQVDEDLLEELAIGTGGKILRFFTFTRILTVIAGIICTIAIIALGSHYLASILQAISASAYEVMAFGSSGGLIYLTSKIQPEYQLFTLIPGCLLLVGAFALADYVHNIKRSTPDIYAFLCALIWGWVAIHYQSGVIGFFAVGALLLAVGVSDLADPMFDWMHPSRNYNDPTPRIALAGFSVLGLDVVWQLTNNHAHSLKVFHGSAEWLGTLTFFLSMLWMSSKYYDDYRKRCGPRFWAAQVIYIASILGSLYLGTMFHLSHLLVMGGWFTGIYLLVKYCELPWKGIGWAWAALGIAGILYFAVGFAQNYPQYFILKY